MLVTVIAVELLPAGLAARCELAVNRAVEIHCESRLFIICNSRENTLAFSDKLVYYCSIEASPGCVPARIGGVTYQENGE